MRKTIGDKFEQTLLRATNVPKKLRAIADFIEEDGTNQETVFRLTGITDDEYALIGSIIVRDIFKTAPPRDMHKKIVNLVGDIFVVGAAAALIHAKESAAEQKQ